MKQYLSSKQIAARTGEPYDTIRSLLVRRIGKGAGTFPLPYVVIGETGSRAATYGWRAEDIDKWHEVYARNKPHSRAPKSRSEEFD